MSQSYLPFLKALSENNHKEWMDANRTWYLEVRGMFLEDVGEMLKAITEWEPDLSGFQAKDCIFRQNRDIRFSANKQPYKTNFAAYFAVGGKKSEGPGYYLHVQPNGTFAAGGIWMPQGDVIKKIRQEIDYSGAQLQEIIQNPAFQKKFGGIEGEKLKTSPKGYDSDHPYIDLLRYKSFIASTPIPDKEIASGAFKKTAVESFRLMKPLQDFLTKAVEDAESGEGIL